MLNVAVADGAIVDTVTIGDGLGGDYVDIVRYARDNQIKSGAGTGVTLKSSGWLDLNGFSDTVKIVSLEGGKITTGSGTLTLGAHLAYSALGTRTAYIEGQSELGRQS